VAVLALEAMAGCEIRSAFVILPDFIETRLARGTAQRALFEDVPFLIALQLKKPRFGVAVEAIRQDDEYFSLHS
jgi:hypothetical protein